MIIKPVCSLPRGLVGLSIYDPLNPAKGGQPRKGGVLLFIVSSVFIRKHTANLLNIAEE